MNLSPDWCGILRAQGWQALHWSEVGEPRAPDREVMAYAAEHQYVVFTHDLEFSAMLAATQALAPSVVQMRGQDTLSSDFRNLVFTSLREYQSVLESGAIVVIEPLRARARILPLPGKTG